MTESILPMKAPFQNFKIFIVINKVLGLVSCKLANGRLRPASTWARCYCVFWILFHCAYTFMSYYKWYIMPPVAAGRTLFFLGIVRFNCYIASLIPYHYIAVSRSQDIIKFSDKLETYDDKAALLGYRRKDKYMFIWLYFIYTLGTLTSRAYFSIGSKIKEGTIAVLSVMFEITIPGIIGTYCVFITVIYLDLIRQRFRHLNETIVPHVSELPVTGSPGEITIYDVRYMHGVLIDSAELINNVYGIGTFFTFTSILVEFISVIYLFIEDIEENNAVVTLVDLVFQAFFLFTMYHLTTLEANCIEESVEKYGLSFQNAKCRLDKIETMLYFYHARFYFTAAEFFVLDLAIFLSMSSTVTTFITIII